MRKNTSKDKLQMINNPKKCVTFVINSLLQVKFNNIAGLYIIYFYDLMRSQDELFCYV